MSDKKHSYNRFIGTLGAILVSSSSNASDFVNRPSACMSSCKAFPDGALNIFRIGNGIPDTSEVESIF